MMENINNVKKLTRSSMLLVFALIIIFIGSRLGGGAMFNQVVVGPLVNAVIISSVLITDLKFGILVSVMTPVLAFVTGQFTILPFVPFIMVGNVILALSVGILNKAVKRYGIYIGIAAGAVLKTAFLMLSVNSLISMLNLPIPKAAAEKLAAAMSYPQLYTALAGGVVAVLFYAVFERTIKR